MVKLTVNLAPFSSSLLTFISPLCALMICFKIARPKPIPLALLVKRGSKIFPIASLGIPFPVSVNSTWIRFSFL